MDRKQQDRYSNLTNAVLDEMCDANPEEWQPGWVSRTKGGRPINATTSKRYRGGNVLQLWLTAAANGYPTNEWAGYGQWQNIDAQVKKGEHGTVIRYVTKKEVEDDTAPDGKRKKIIVCWPTVFNASQVDGYEPAEIELPDVAEIEQTAEDFLKTTGADIRHGGDRALWNRADDYIAIPNREQFISTDNYYATTFHELTHWTGAAHRLDRTCKAGSVIDATQPKSSLPSWAPTSSPPSSTWKPPQRGTRPGISTTGSSYSRTTTERSSQRQPSQPTPLTSR